MKSITIHFDNGAEQTLKSSMIIKKVTGNLYGVEDNFVIVVLYALHKEMEEVIITHEMLKKDGF